MADNYGRVHHESLKESRPDVLKELERHGERFQYFSTTARDAKDLHERLVEQLAANHPYTEADYGSPDRWQMWLNQVARELVLNDRILIPDEETERAQRDGYLD